MRSSSLGKAHENADLEISESGKLKGLSIAEGKIGENWPPNPLNWPYPDGIPGLNGGLNGGEKRSD